MNQAFKRKHNTRERTARARNEAQNPALPVLSRSEHTNNVGPYQILLDYSFMALSRRAHTSAEMEKKLARRIKLKGIGSQQDQRRVIKRLKELSYLDDNAFAKSYIISKTATNPKGRYLITRELRLKGIPNDIINKTWEHLKIDEEDLAKKLMEKKKRTINRVPVDKRREKILYYLSSRGFHPDIIYDLLAKNHQS